MRILNWVVADVGEFVEIAARAKPRIQRNFRILTHVDMKIADIRATTVSVPIEVPLHHASQRLSPGGRFVRTIVEVKADNGPSGLGELGGASESAEAACRAIKPYGRGQGPARLEEGAL